MNYLNASVRSNNEVKAKVNYTYTSGNECVTQGKESEVMKRIAGLKSAITNITDLVT